MLAINGVPQTWEKTSQASLSSRGGGGALGGGGACNVEGERDLKGLISRKCWGHRKDSFSVARGPQQRNEPEFPPIGGQVHKQLPCMCDPHHPCPNVQKSQQFRVAEVNSIKHMSCYYLLKNKQQITKIPPYTSHLGNIIFLEALGCCILQTATGSPQPRRRVRQRLQKLFGDL